MLLETERIEIVRYGKKLLQSGLTTATGGNLSIFNRSENLVAISPSGVDYYETQPEAVVVLTLDGDIMEGTHKPSSELHLHLSHYQRRSDIRAVVHTHSGYATTLACLNWELPALHYLVGFSGKKVPLAPYATFGTKELARDVSEAMGDHNAVLMANHGVLTVGTDIKSAFNTAEVIEYTARLYYQARCIGKPVILTDSEMETVIEKFKTYGQK
jgi:L-fuculose-phosphate aldolase